MSAFDAQINVVDQTILVAEDQKSFQVALTLGLVVPVATPNGLQPAMTSLGVLRFAIDDRAKGEALADAIRTASENLPKASDLLVASNLGQVEEAARRMEAAKSGALG
jgi:hypothetical protein